MEVTYAKNTDRPETYAVYSPQMQYSEEHMDSSIKIIDCYYRCISSSISSIQVQLGTDMDIQYGIDAIVTYGNNTQDTWQIRNRSEYEYAGDIAIKMEKNNGDKDEIYTTTATHYLTTHWAGTYIASIAIVDYVALRQRVLSNADYYRNKCIKGNSWFYAMPYAEYKDICHLYRLYPDNIAKHIKERNNRLQQLLQEIKEERQNGI